MKKISEITRRDIIDIIRDGFIYEERRPTGLKTCGTYISVLQICPIGEDYRK